MPATRAETIVSQHDVIAQENSGLSVHPGTE